MTTNKLKNAGPTNPLWPGPKTIKTADDIVQLALRWKNALEASWAANPDDATIINTQYAPDGAVAYKSQSNSGFSTGSTLLATVDGNILDTAAERAAYFTNTFLPGQPVPLFDQPLQFRMLSKDVRKCLVRTSLTIQGWSLTLAALPLPPDRSC